MADVLVDEVHDGLAERLDLLLVAVDVGDPAQRLAGRGDVVAGRGEHHHRRADGPHVEGGAGAGADLAAREAVADEQVLDDPVDLVAVHQVVAAPPALEFQEARRLGVDVLVQVVVAPEPGGAGREGLEVQHQVGAVELAVAEVGEERGRPGSAREAAEIAHRVPPALAGPVGEGRAVQHQRAGQLRLRRAEHHHRPAALAIADHHRLRRVRMQVVDAAEEGALGRGDVEDGLARLRIAEEDDEVDGVAAPERHADLAVALEAADARAVAGARVDDDEGAELGIGRRGALRHLDAHQGVVHRPRQVPAVHHHVPLEEQDRRAALLLMRDEGVAGLAHHVPEQDRALPRIHRVLHRAVQQAIGTVERGERFGFATAGREAAAGKRREEGHEQRIPGFRPLCNAA